jgi:hypothetical protein
LKRARSRVIASVVNGDTIPLVHNRIEDARFTDLEIIPMGADKVFMQSLSHKDILTMLGEAKEFFDHFFSNIARRDKKEVPFKRGAWLRLYGIPLHAWNEIFFELCVMDCGSYLRTDIVSLDRDRFDYAWMLIVIPSLEIVNLVDTLLIDSEMMEINIVEEWGFNIGEDACLFEEVDGLNSQSDHEDVPVDPKTCNNVDNMIDKIVDDLADEELLVLNRSKGEDHVVMNSETVAPIELHDNGS